MECVICAPIHGRPGCPAGRIDAEGRPVCVFCEDRIPCAQQMRILRSGTNVLERAAHIVEIRRPDQDAETARRLVLNHSISISQSKVAAARKSQEDHMSTARPTASAAPTSTPAAPRARVCSTCKKKPLAYNNVTGVCGECQGQGRVQSKANGHNGVHPDRELQAARKRQAAPAKPNGADHHHDHDEPSRGNGNGAQPNPMRLLAMPPASRVDLLLAAIPYADKARMLSAWIAGKL